MALRNAFTSLKGGQSLGKVAVPKKAKGHDLMGVLVRRGAWLSYEVGVWIRGGGPSGLKGQQTEKGPPPDPEERVSGSFVKVGREIIDVWFEVPALLSSAAGQSPAHRSGR